MKDTSAIKQCKLACGVVHLVREGNGMVRVIDANRGMSKGNTLAIVPSLRAFRWCVDNDLTVLAKA